MESIIHADIFFFVATIALVILTLASLVVAWYAVTVLAEIRQIIVKVQKSANNVTDAIDNITADVQEDGVVATVAGLLHQTKKKKKRIVINK